MQLFRKRHAASLLWAIPQAFSSPEKAWLREAKCSLITVHSGLARVRVSLA